MIFFNKLIWGCGLLICCHVSPTYAVPTSAMPSVQTIDSLRSRPDHVNNAESRCFPPVFSQDGGSCGSASRIGYMFTHEINAFRHADASKTENIYPTHFTWLLTNSHSGKEGMAKANGIPNAAVYGGTTYSKVFGNQDCANADFGWMQGYDKWYSAMFNRISHNSFSPDGLDTEKGREYIKNWLWNHQGDDDFAVGGICGIGVASACKPAPIADDPEGRNAATGLVGQKYVTRWGDGVDHALTIVGYDDRLVFDLDSNNVYGEKDKDECGAWIIVNSWGNGWANKGFIYCPYKYGFPVRQHEGGAWKPEFYHVRKNYRPLRTLKVRMDYSHRSELKLLIGVSADLNAREPDVTTEMEHFKNAGDGRSEKAKQGVEAPTPMLGKWADGILHDEPMEFGYDLTDLSSGFDTRCPLKYFFIIERIPTSIGTGKLYNCSLIDYEFDKAGIETLFPTGDGLQIENQGNRTLVSAIVHGEPFFAPRNLQCPDGKTLVWDQPQPTPYPLKSYVLFKNNEPADTLALNRRNYPCNDPTASYAVAALYEYPDNADSIPATAQILSARSRQIRPDFSGRGIFHTLRLQKGSFVIPHVFDSRHEQATIEYWLKPQSWYSWNQGVGPGWGNFLIHANDDGALTAGWDGDNRMDTRKGLITPDKWYHFAFVIAKDTLTAYVNGEPVDTLISRTRSGIGGFGDLTFGSGKEGDMSGDLSEVRIWKEARTAQQIREMMHRGFAPAGVPSTLLAYYKGQIIEENGVRKWRDFAGSHHAEFTGSGHYEEADRIPEQSSTIEPGVDFVLPEGPLYAGQAFQLHADCSPSVASVYWEVPGAETEKISIKTPTLLFQKAGNHTVKLIGATAEGKTVAVQKDISILPVQLNADFHPTQTIGSAGERISFHPLHPLPGYRYEWTMPGADAEKACTQSAAATYASAGDYRVKLRVTHPFKGKSKSETYKLHVQNVAPSVQFELSPRIILKGQEVTFTDRSRYVPTSWKWQIDSRRFTCFAEGKNPTVSMDVPGVYDVTLTASNEMGERTATQKQVLLVCNADSKNGLNFSRPQALVTTDKPLWDGATDEMTVDWWMNPSANDRSGGIGDTLTTWQLITNAKGNMTLYADSLSINSGNEFVIPGQWHHYAVTFKQGEVKFLRDGEVFKTNLLKDKKRTVSQIPAFEKLQLGGEKQPMNAVIDEFRIWRKALSDTLLRQYCNAPIRDVAQAENSDALILYYSFNQSGGDVQDLSSHRYNGRRENFGPDGDAWGASAGVFCLNFETPLTDLTTTLLPPSSRPFMTTGETVNQKNAKRFLEFKTNQSENGWYAENFVSNDTIRTGFYVDKNKDDALCVYTGWDGFATELANHKLYCTVKLPAGKYELEAIPLNGFPSGGSYLVAAPGKGLPDTGKLSSAIASGPLSNGRLSFILTEEANVSLGILINLQGNSGIALDRIELHRCVVGE